MVRVIATVRKVGQIVHCFPRVGGLLDWSRSIQVGSTTVMYHVLPKRSITLQKLSAGDKTFTVTLCKTGNSLNMLPYAFRLIMLPAFNNHAKAGFIDIVYNTWSEASFLCSNVCGDISNVRNVQYNGDKYIACDIAVNQFGENTLYVVGLHNDLSEIMDVTGKFSEIK